MFLQHCVKLNWVSLSRSTAHSCWDLAQESMTGVVPPRFAMALEAALRQTQACVVLTMVVLLLAFDVRWEGCLQRHGAQTGAWPAQVGLCCFPVSLRGLAGMARIASLFP